MADYMRDRMVYKVFHSTDEDAVDHLMTTFQAMFPNASETDLDEVRASALTAIDQAKERHAYFAISPGGMVELLSAEDVAYGWEDVDADVWAEVQQERQHQIDLGYTGEHDRAHGVGHLIDIATDYLTDIPKDAPLEQIHGRLVKSMALLQAASDVLDHQKRQS